jgi:hypothetical protein
VWVVDEGTSVVSDRRPRGVPADSVLTCHRGDRPAQLTDLAGDLGPGPLGEDLPRGDAGELLRPRLSRAPGNPAPPPDENSWVTSFSPGTLCCVTSFNSMPRVTKSPEKIDRSSISTD